MNEKIRAVVIGFHEYTPYLLSTLHDNQNVELRALISQTRQSINGRSPVESVKPSGAEFIVTESLNNNEIKNFLTNETIDLGVCLGWYEVISEEILAAPTHGIIGVHAAPLPEGRGQAPVNHQIIYGMENATVSVFQFSSEVDAGDIVDQKSIPIFPTETVDSLYERLSYHGVNIIDDSLDLMARGELETVPQFDQNATYWPERRPSDSLIDWDLSSDLLYRFIRALTGPYPNAFTYHNQTKLKITQATSYPDITSDLRPGEVIGTRSEEALMIQTGSGVLGIERIALPNEPVISGREMATRLDVSSGDTLCSDTEFPDGFVYTGLRGPGGKSDLELKTNITVGSTAKNHVYCFVPKNEMSVHVKAKTDGRVLINETKLVTGHEKFALNYTAESKGNSLVKILFPNIPQEDRQFVIYSQPKQGK
jgi:methionyl-tRNA formyltransferase